MKNQHIFRVRFARTLLLASACSLAIAGAAHAQAQNQAQHSFDIPAESAADALKAFAKQSGKQVMFPYDAVAGRQTPAISGTLSDQAVLQQLADAAGLKISADNGSVVTLVHAAPAAGPRPEGIQEVIVTAARHSQNLQRVSSAVQVVGGDKITNQGLTNVAQIVQDLPSVQSTGQPGGYSIDIRGQGGDLPAGSTQGSTALEFDGVYNINSQGTTVGFFDVDRIEVLPGPQSTRYGPDADGGVMNVITKDPRLNNWSGDASVGLGNYGSTRLEFAQNIPLGDTFALRLSGATLNRSSYFTNPTEGNVRAQSLRAKLLWKPEDSLTVKLTLQQDHIGGTGNGSNVFPMFTDKVAVYSGDSINDKSNPWTGVPNINSGQTSITQDTVNGDVSWDINSAMGLDVLASYIVLRGGETGCLYAPPWDTVGGGPFPLCGASMHEFDPFTQFSSEVRLHSAAGARVTWNIGLYHWDYANTLSLTDASFFDSPATTTTTATNAIFGEITYPLTDKLRLIGGLRKSFDHRTFEFVNQGTVTQPFTYKMDHGDYRAGVEYDLTPKSMAYVTVSTGYRPGGDSGYNPIVSAPNTFGPESNTAYELGLKNRFLDNRLQINGDVFVYKQFGYQNLDKYTGFYITVPGVTGTVECTNQTNTVYAGCVTPTWNLKAHVYGFEAQLRYALTNADMVSFNGTWLDAQFDKKQKTCATVGVSSSLAGYTGAGKCYDGYNDQYSDDLKLYEMAGAVQPHSPKFSGNLAYNHTFSFASGAALALGGSVFYSTGYWLNPVEDDEKYGWQPGYYLEGLQLSYTPAKGNWAINAYVHNLSNYAVKESVLPATSLGDPRTVGVVLSERW